MRVFTPSLSGSPQDGTGTARVGGKLSGRTWRCAALQPRTVRRAKVRNGNGTALILFRSLKYRIAATIFFLEAIVLAVVLWQSHQLSFSLSQQEQMVKANIIADLLSESSRNALFDYEFGTLQTLLERACDIGPLERALLLDHRSRVVASSTSGLLGREIQQLPEQPGTYTLARKVETLGGLDGRLLVTFSKAQLTGARAQALELGIKIGLFGMALIAVFGMLFGYLLTRRLDKVIDYTKKVAKGEFQEPLKISGNDEVAELSAALSDMSSQLQSSFSTMRHLAYHDPLTGLANREEFNRRLAAAMKSTETHNDVHALMYLDLDGFKIVNDTCGHAVGDELLVKLTQQLGTVIRSRDTLGRLGGDEFGVLLERCPPYAAVRIGEQLIEEAKRVSVEWQGRQLAVGVSVGMAIVSDKSPDLPQLLQEVDDACYAAKAAGGGTLRSVSPQAGDAREAVDKKRAIDQLTAVFDEGRWELHYQEIVSLASTHQPVCWEILLRLRDDKGVSGPEKFMRAAERYKMMSRIDLHVVKMAFDHLSNTPVCDKPLITFINLSSHSINDELFLSGLQKLVEDYAQEPGSICFELTEAEVTKHYVAALSFLGKLKKIGFKVALDDFGVGFSSYHQFKNIPLDYIKINGMLVRDLHENRTNQLIIQSISDVANEFRVKTIAKFVETTNALETLQELGADYAQGYALGYPKQLPYPAGG